MKIFSLTLTAMLGAAMGICAQGNGKVLTYATSYREPVKSTTSTATTSRIDDSNYLKPEYLNNISVAAVRDFIKRFSERPGTRWYKMGDGSFMAKFEEPGDSYRVTYDNRGGWIYTVQTYYEKKLPREVRAIVKSTYYDYSITQIEEIDHVDAEYKVYIVHMKDDVSWKTVRVCNGEMDVMETLYKK